jgi:hypothetical protein
MTYAEPSKMYPNEAHYKWTWDSYNTAYVLSEYDKIASKPGCREWLDKTGYSVGSANRHQLPNIGVFISAAIDAKWVVEFDYTKPVKGAIVYHDKNRGMPDFSSRFNFIRDVQNNIVTIEWMDKTGTIKQRQIPIEKMEYFGNNKFRGYIYPYKVGKKLKD